MPVIVDNSEIYAGSCTLSVHAGQIVAPPPPGTIIATFRTAISLVALNEAIAVLTGGLQNLMANAPASTSADLRLACNNLIAAADSEIIAGALSADLFNCFEQAVTAGITPAGMASVRNAAEALTPTYLQGQLIATALVRFCLIEESKLLAVETFTSSNDIDATIDYIGPAFDAAIVYASQENDTATYMALITLQGAVINNLAAQALRLPRLVSYTFAQSMPALWLAQRLYGDPTRALELVQENKVVHPAFCPRAINALSA